MRRGNRGSSCVVSESAVFLSSGDGYVVELLELLQGCQGNFQGSRQKVGFLLRRSSRKGPYLALKGESHGFSRVATANVGSQSSYDGKTGSGFWGPQESQVSLRVARGSEIPLQSLPGPRSSSGVEAKTSGFLSLADMDLRVPLGFPQESKASSLLETYTSVHLFSWESKVRLPLEVT